MFQTTQSVTKIKQIKGISCTNTVSIKAVKKHCKRSSYCFHNERLTDLQTSRSRSNENHFHNIHVSRNTFQRIFEQLDIMNSKLKSLSTHVNQIIELLNQIIERLDQIAESLLILSRNQRISQHSVDVSQRFSNR